MSPTRTWAVKVLAWSGPSSVMTYSGTPELSWAVSSCRLVFQSRPAPMRAALRITGSKSRWTTSRATSKPPER